MKQQLIDSLTENSLVIEEIDMEENFENSKDPPN